MYVCMSNGVVYLVTYILISALSLDIEVLHPDNVRGIACMIITTSIEPAASQPNELNLAMYYCDVL